MSGVSLNRDYYEASSPGRDDYWRYMAAPRQRVARVLELVRELGSATLVDFGCGNGRLLDEIAAALPMIRLGGIDLSARQIDENRARSPHIEWLQADLQQPIETRSTFDAVVASEVIEHVDDAAMLLENARHMVRSSGHLIVTTQSGPVHETERRVGHVRHFSAAEMTEALRQTGWTPLRVWNEGFPFHDLSKWWANRDPDTSMQRFGGAHRYGSVARAVCFALRLMFRLNSRTRGFQLYALAVKRA